MHHPKWHNKKWDTQQLSSQTPGKAHKVLSKIAFFSQIICLNHTWGLLRDRDNVGLFATLSSSTATRPPLSPCKWLLQTQALFTPQKPGMAQSLCPARVFIQSPLLHLFLGLCLNLLYRNITSSFQVVYESSGHVDLHGPLYVALGELGASRNKGVNVSTSWTWCSSVFSNSSFCLSPRMLHWSI